MGGATCNSGGTSTSAPYPLRHFWRRLFAYGIDAALCWVIVAILFAVFIKDTLVEELANPETTVTFALKFDTAAFLPPFQIGTTTCGDLAAPPADIVAAVRPGQIDAIVYCLYRFLGIPVGGVATVEVMDTPEVADWPSRSVDLELFVLSAHRFADEAALGLLVGLSILFVRMFATTPGKRLMGLSVVGPAPLPAFRREMMRNLPYILSVGVSGLMIEFAHGNPLLTAQALMLRDALTIVAAGAAVYLWFWPMLRWKGGLVHDRWLGLHVVRT